MELFSKQLQSQNLKKISGVGIGLRQSFLSEIEPAGFQPGWFEITPENWVEMPYHLRDDFERIAASFPLVAHGVSLSIGSPEEPDRNFLRDLKIFFDRYGIEHYSEHISYSTWFGAQSYELMPVPMTERMGKFIARKAKMIGEILERRLILENPSYYYIPESEMVETDFINFVLEESGAGFLLDVNNVYVNSVNHGFQAKEFIDKLHLDKVSYLHIAGHTWFEEDRLIIDTHGEQICQEVRELLRYTLRKVEAPVLIERDNNIPPLAEMITEYDEISLLTEKVQNEKAQANGAAPSPENNTKEKAYA